MKVNTVGLTTKQKEELHSAIYEYLVKNKFLQAAQALSEEASGCQLSQTGGGGVGVLKDLLERKWTSVAKLKKEVDELTKQNKVLKEVSGGGACERCGGTSGAGAGLVQGASVAGDGLPREPEKFILRGHKSRIT